MQCRIFLEAVFEQRNRSDVAPRLGISVHTCANHLRAAFRSLRFRVTQDGDVFTEVDRSPRYDLIEELRERFAAARLRPASGKTGERSTSERDRSNSEGDRGKTAGDAGSARVYRSNVRHDRRNVGGHPD